ncbi:MAG: hypothetical protein WBF90_25405 [Rivularia sp. (in: cyanobacteria)]
MESGNGWSRATDGVEQRMELSNGWSWATDGVGTTGITVPCSLFPAPYSLLPTPYSLITGN